jgi:hypothetical protein
MIVKIFIKQNGYDGLYNNDADCACKLSDIAPCGQLGHDCQTGYLQPEDQDDDFRIGPEKLPPPDHTEE